MPVIAKLKYGNTNTFLIRGERGNLLVDTDYAGTLPGFYQAYQRAYETGGEAAASGYSAAPCPLF